ncbi:hypothetical protein LSH36_275g05004 [Paralvinella palmiformis]|uniref:Uncharacterized protein n=1 Tax=Paralvinella palmiformis TaxID=53620 RepID=A0AAD9JJ44_9ANNE|nr:hypothetical protein LSH36_275g05004 [Paralvinella palmiformis]
MTSGDMKTEDSFLEPVKQSNGCVKNNLAKALLPSGIVASLKNTEQSQKSELLGKRKKKNYNKLFNHRTRKRCKRAKMVVKMEDVDPEQAEQSDQMVSVTLLNCCEEVDKAVDGSERVLPQGSACLTDTANKTKNYCILTETIDRNLESTAKMSAGKAKPKKTRGKGATLKKCSGQKRIGSQTAKRAPKKGRGRQIPTDFQGHSTGSRKVKVKRKPSKKDPAKGKKVKFGKRKNGDKKGTAVTQPKTSRGRWKRKRHRKDFASKGVQEFCENLSCNQASGSHEFEKDISLEINTATDIQQEMNVQCEQTVTELKQNDLASFVKRPSTGVTTDCCLTVGCLQHQKSFDASNRCESPERRRPGLVHRRHLILDNDADDDVGYHSSGSLDQVLHDESYDTAGGRTSQSVQRKELEGFQRETPESQRMVCRHIRRLVTNLCTSQQVNSNKLFKPELDNIKKEITNKDSEKMTVNLLKTRSFLDSLIPPPEGSQQGSISDGEMLKCEANMKQEPTSGSETGRMSARNAINDFAAKLNKFKFRVRPETLKGQKSSLAVDDTTYNVKLEQPEPEKLNDQCELAGSSGLVINRCDSGVYVESPTDGLMKLTSVTGGVERKLIKSEMPMESKRRSLWDCILPDLLSNADKSHTDGTMDGETRLLTRIKTEGSGQEKKHYIYCPACCSQVLIKAEPPAGSSLSCSGVIPHNEALSNQGESSSDVTSMDCFSSKVSSCMTSNEEDGNHTPLHVSEGWSLKQDPQIASCSQESQLSSSDLMFHIHGNTSTVLARTTTQMIVFMADVSSTKVKC